MYQLNPTSYLLTSILNVEDYLGFFRNKFPSGERAANIEMLSQIRPGIWICLGFVHKLDLDYCHVPYDSSKEQHYLTKGSVLNIIFKFNLY